MGDAIVAEELGNEADVIEALAMVFGPHLSRIIMGVRYEYYN